MPRESARKRARTAEPVTSIYLWGSHRDHVNELARRAAGVLDPHFAWLEVAEALSSPSPDPGTAANAFAPPPGVGPETVSSYLGAEGQEPEGQDLQNFLRMSTPIQGEIERLLGREPPRVLVVANLERLRAFFCPDPNGRQPFIDWLNAREITFIASSTGAPLPEGKHFDYLATRPDETTTNGRTPIVAVRQREPGSSEFLRRLFRPDEVLVLSGLSVTPPETSTPAP